MYNQREKLLAMIQMALFIALTLVVRQFSYMVNFAGAGGMRVSFEMVFSHMIPVLFGPLYGALSLGLIDVLAYLSKPEGAFIYPLTAVAVLSGALLGISWRLARRIELFKANKIINYFIKLIAALVVPNLIMSTLNTFVLRWAFPALGKIPFWAFYTPRIVKEVPMTIICAYIMSILLVVYGKVQKKNDL